MAKNIDNRPIKNLIEDLEQGTLDVNQLNLARANHREAFRQALIKRPALLTKVSSANEKHFFTFAIKENPNYFVHLDKSQYTNELAQIYIFERLTDSAIGKKADENVATADILVQKSFDDKAVFTYSYLTPEGDELYYFDPELQVPVSLKSSIMITLKLENAVELIDKLDTHITQLGEKKIKSVITGTVANQYKSYLNQYIKDNNMGYYTLCTSLSEVQKGFKKVIANAFADYGITVSEFVIKKIAIPRDIQFKLEDQAFKIRQRRADIEADNEFAKLSLESYEAKLAVMQKYPNAELTLTEYEKDLALKRYLTKTGRLHEDEVDHSIKISQKKPQADFTVEKREDIIPDIPVKPNIFLRGFVWACALAFLISVIVMANNFGAGMIVFGIMIAILGIVAGFNEEKFEREAIEPTMEDYYDSDDLNNTKEA